MQSAAMLVRREAAAQVGYLDPDFFVYSEEVDFQKRLRDAGWRVLHVPAARAIHHEQLATDRSAGARRVVQFHRGRAMYMRKHHSRPVAVHGPHPLGVVVRPARGRRASSCPATIPRWYWLHARRALRPSRGEGMREAAEAYNLRSSRPGVARPARPLRRAGRTDVPGYAARSGAAAVLVAGGGLVDLRAEPRPVAGLGARSARRGGSRSVRARAAIADGRSNATRRERSSSWRKPIAYRTAG